MPKRHVRGSLYALRGGVAAVVLVATVSRGLDGQGVEGYFVGEEVDLPWSMLERTDDGRFSISVLRSGANPFERRLIVHAESLFPEQHVIESDIATFLSDFRQNNLSMGVWPRRFEAAAAVPGPRWWWLLGGGANWPYAVTGAGVAHYIERVRHLRSSPNPAARYNPGVQHSATFEYSARVVRSDAARYIVELRMSWEDYCGPLCAMGFEHSRRVTFAADGTLLSVEGDGPPSVWQS